MISWFSCGAASAVATKLALREHDNVRIIYQDTGSEHSDNERFIVECEQWFGQKIERTKSDKYSDIWEVFEKTRYLVGVGGARCTSELKRKVAESIVFDSDAQPVEVFGYTIDEKHRVERFIKQNSERKIKPILIEKGFSKADCLGYLAKSGIELPAMYKLGYQNNNCIGCVKGQAGYWNKIRKDFPEVFDRMAKVERELNAAINKKYVKGERIRVFLDEMPEDMGRNVKEPEISCGIICMGEL